MLAWTALSIGCASPGQQEVARNPSLPSQTSSVTTALSRDSRTSQFQTASGTEQLPAPGVSVPPAQQPVVPAAFSSLEVVAAQPDVLPPPPPFPDTTDREPTNTLEPIPSTPTVEGNNRQSLPIDFGTALSLTQGQNPRIAFAQTQISQAFAQYEAARVMWLPSIRAGTNYNKHEGRIQDVEGSNIEASRGAAFGGLGAGAVGAGSPAVPGVYVQFNLSDAIHQPQIRSFAVNARRFESTAATNDQLMETSLAYLSLLAAHQQKAIASETLSNGEELAELTADFARAGAGTQADADRATAALALLRNEVVRAEEAMAVASARLAQQLSADPAILIVPQEPTVVPIELVGLERELSELVATGLSNRPELGASRSLVSEAVSRLRREEHAPWLPSLALGASYGAFGAGTGGDITNGADRFDFDAVAWWEVRNLGLGESAARDIARAQIQAARTRDVETMDVVAREIVESHAQAQARKRQVTIAEQGIESAQQSHARNLERIKNGQGLPIEVLQSIQALDAARRDYLRSVVDYDTAQFRLQRGLGWPISEP